MFNACNLVIILDGMYAFMARQLDYPIALDVCFTHIIPHRFSSAVISDIFFLSLIQYSPLFNSSITEAIDAKSLIFVPNVSKVYFCRV